MFSEDQSLIYILGAVLIFLSLMAALGAWIREKGLNRKEAEYYFDKNRQQTAEEMVKLQKKLDDVTDKYVAELNESRRQFEETVGNLSQKLNSTAQDLNRSIENTAHQQINAITEKSDRLQHELNGTLQKLESRFSTVETGLAEHGSSQTASLERIEGTMGGLQRELMQATNQVRISLSELTRQQQEAKAHSAMQLCEALINSLGTLKNSISKQVEDSKLQSEPVLEIESEDIAHLAAADDTEEELTLPEETESLYYQSATLQNQEETEPTSSENSDENFRNLLAGLADEMGEKDNSFNDRLNTNEEVN